MMDTSTVVQTMFLVFVVTVAIGSVVGYPVGLGYVNGDSMEPTLERGDGFVAVPTPLADVSQGDVVVFETDDGLTTHRVVEVTDKGYVTKGDANPFTDQDGDRPIVTDERVKAEALRVGGEVLTVPGLGSVSESVDALFGVISRDRGMDGKPFLAYILLVLSVAGYLYETARRRIYGNRGRDVGRGTVGTRHLRLVAVAVVVVAVVATVTLPSGTRTVDTVGAEFESDSPLVIETGEAETVSYEVSNGGFVPVVAYIRSEDDRVSVERSHVTVPGGGTGEVPIEVEAPEETGYRPVTVTERRYLALLPLPVVEDLYETDPLLPHIVTIVLVGGGVYSVGRIVLPEDAGQRPDRGTERRRGRRG
jgi:signal peptidase